MSYLPPLFVFPFPFCLPSKEKEGVKISPKFWGLKPLPAQRPLPLPLETSEKVGRGWRGFADKVWRLDLASIPGAGKPLHLPHPRPQKGDHPAGRRGEGGTGIQFSFSHYQLNSDPLPSGLAKGAGGRLTPKFHCRVPPPPQIWVEWVGGEVGESAPLPAKRGTRQRRSLLLYRTQVRRGFGRWGARGLSSLVSDETIPPRPPSRHYADHPRSISAQCEALVAVPSAFILMPFIFPSSSIIIPLVFNTGTRFTSPLCRGSKN